MMKLFTEFRNKIWTAQQSVNIYSSLMPLQNNGTYIINMANRKNINFTQLDQNYSKENPYFYIVTLSDLDEDKKFVQAFSLFNYKAFTNSIFSHDIYDAFSIPGYGVPILDNPLFYNEHYKTIFGYNHSKINAELDLLQDNGTLFDNKIYYIYNC